MPVVPYVRKSDAANQGFSPRRPLTAAEEPWALMAAAEMDKQGRLVEPEASSPMGKQLGTDDLDKAQR